MNNLPDNEISRRLALAIGWSDVYYHDLYDTVYVRDESSSDHFKKFDYRDHAVYAPIAERFNAFPEKMRLGPLWAAPVTPDGKRPEYPFLRWEYADTAAKAVALAVIKAKEQT